MNQEEIKDADALNQSAAGTPEENLNPEELAASLSEQASSSREVDSLPIESIGSYARLEELVTEEESGNTSNPTAQS